MGEVSGEEEVENHVHEGEDNWSVYLHNKKY